jgi:glycosyltransferase involved in cell wall biosynthesis
MRAMNLSNSLVEDGHNVVLWSSAFYHQEKKHRSLSPQTIIVSPQLEIRLVPSPGYNRNIGFGRLWDHLVLAYNLKKMLRNEQSLPDVAFVGYPPIETASVLTGWLANRGIPCLLDLKDQWPSLFLDPLPTWLRPIGKLLLWPYFYYGKGAMQQATGLSSMASSFLQWGLDIADRKVTKYDGVFPLTSPPITIEDSKLKLARVWWDEKDIVNDPSIFRVIFIGSHMSVFDFEPVRNAARTLCERGIKSQFVICGDGGFSAQLRSMMENIPNVCFPGWVDRAQIEALAERSQAALAPYRNIDNFTKNLPNKVIDALALGLPILSPLHGEVANMIAEHNVGMQYGNAPGRSLLECIDVLRTATDQQKLMATNARELFRLKFSFRMVYGGLVRHLVSMASRSHTLQ